MGVLNADEITRRLAKGGLLTNVRTDDNGDPDVEPDSYDLSAGTAVWKSPTQEGAEGKVVTLHFRKEEQPTVTVNPGQMIFVITHEEVVMPENLCGTVYSRNRLATQGILALNAGHIDPAFRGPIVIRLINLRATPWTLTLGTPIFTVVFETVDASVGDRPPQPSSISPSETLLRVREMADEALSNALLDIFDVELQQRLSQHSIAATAKLTDKLSVDFVRRDQLLWEIVNAIWRRFVGGLALIGIIVGIVLAFQKWIID